MKTGPLTESELEWLDERLFPFMVLTGEAEAAAKEPEAATSALIRAALRLLAPKE